MGRTVLGVISADVIIIVLFVRGEGAAGGWENWSSVGLDGGKRSWLGCDRDGAAIVGNMMS